MGLSLAPGGSKTTCDESLIQKPFGSGYSKPGN